jgi:hypothetical protein
MKKKIIIPFLFVNIANLAAQTSTSNLSQPVRTPGKNEISLNTAPVFRQLLSNSKPISTRFSFSYKRYLNEHSALRFSIMADLISKVNDNHYRREIILMNPDSVLIRQETISPGYVSPHLNLGYERLFGRKKLKWFYGTDLSIGYSESRSFKQNTHLQKDSTTSFGWIEGAYQPEIVSRIKTETFSIGLSPFFGAKYPISKKFSISAQVGIDMAIKNEYVSEKSAAATKNRHYSSFDFNMDTGFLNDISIIYKF